MSDLIISEPLAAQIREAAAKTEQTPEEMLTVLLAQWERQRRAKEFERMMRPFGEELEKLGWTEEDADAHVERVRQRLH